MAERLQDNNTKVFQNWEERCFSSYGPNFRIESGNPQMGISGENVYQFYGVTDDKDQCFTSLSKGGHYRILNDRSIEITAGNKSEEEGIDIALNAIDGGISLSCLRNGAIQLKARNIILDALEDIDIKSGRNISITAGSTLKLKGFKVEIDESSVFGNLVEAALGGFGAKVFEATAAFESVGFDSIAQGIRAGANIAKSVGETPLAEIAAQGFGFVNTTLASSGDFQVALEFPEPTSPNFTLDDTNDDTNAGPELELF